MPSRLTASSRKQTSRKLRMRAPPPDRQCLNRARQSLVRDITKVAATEAAARDAVILEILRQDDARRLAEDPDQSCTGKCDAAGTQCSTEFDEVIDTRITCRRARRGGGLVWVCRFNQGNVKTKCSCL